MYIYFMVNNEVRETKFYQMQFNANIDGIDSSVSNLLGLWR